ncbi:uncharacterized protein LOC111089210 [Limulus polyphemus]|uniref:Uncharacterized protein LOC111089210 n=1 Tax=Limulus polyphemus TaxID=6850 RepID=A0ABM1TM75_LIMPO|nr:uncharacterized protein LOC111089210 [Limulus polyphemus]
MILVKMGKMMRKVVTLCLLLCLIPLLAVTQAQSIDEEVKERLEVLDCTNTTCYTIKANGFIKTSWNPYSSSSCQLYGLTPAKPTDEDTAKFLMNLAKRTITDDYPVWLSLSQEETVNNSAFINLWGTYQPQTVVDGKVAMKRKSGFKWEITNPSTEGWSLCEIPKGMSKHLWYISGIFV